MVQIVLSLFLLLCSFQASALETLLKLYRPYEPTDQVKPEVKDTLTGSCMSQSRLLIREDAWRCSAGGKIYDPCFVKSGSNRKEALCPQSPWTSESVLIQVNVPLNNEQNKTLDMSRTYPWAVELTDGEQCQAIYSDKEYDHMPVRYQCTDKKYLVGYLQRCKALWSMLQKNPKGVVTVMLRKAWF